MSSVPTLNLTNQFLIAMPNMGDENFVGTVIYLCDHTEHGALGLVINRPTTLKMSDLFEKVDLQLERHDLTDAPVFLGGPVQNERGFVLHEQIGTADESAYNSTLRIPGGLEMTTSKDVLEAMSHGKGPQKVFVSLGYSGWGAGQLEDELSRNGWLTVEAQHELIFDTPVELRYEKALGLLGIDINMLSADAGHA